MKRGLVALFLAGLTPLTFAQSNVRVATFEAAARRSWSAEDYARARPFPLPRLDAALLSRTAPPEKSEDLVVESDDSFDEAKPPSLSAEQQRAFARVLFDFPPERLRALRGPDRLAAPAPEKSYGDSGLDFTSSRLIPRYATTVFPYSAVGKLFFSDGVDNFTCSGAVIAPRLVITAAHCVHDGPVGGFFTDFQFVPGYRDGEAPFGVWEVDAVYVTEGWVNSGEIPHRQDWAVLQMADQGGTTIAEVSGRLTYQLYRLNDNHLHLLGYPGNLDDGEEMHQVTSGDWVEFEKQTVVYGSDMGGGSSGGPWVQNFSRRSRGQKLGFSGRLQAVVGVTSYGFTEETIMAQGASRLTFAFADLREAACANREGNCDSPPLAR